MAETLPTRKYPAKAHCKKVADLLASTTEKDAPTIIYLQGQMTRMQEDNDEPQPFRQRRHFFYLSGCNLPDCHLTYDIPTSTLTLFIPPLDPDSVIWSGLPLSPDDALEKYDIDACLPTLSLSTHLSNAPPNSILFLTPRSDPPPNPPANINSTSLHPALDTARITKDPWEIAAIRHANTVTTAAHISVLQSLPHASNEQHLAAAFLSRCLALGCKSQAYSGIFGSGPNAATLHYQANDAPLAGRRTLLVDAAAEWECYCADVTRTMPLHASGFDRESESVYIIVQSMQEACFKLLAAGVRWEDVHFKAHEVAVEGLLALGLLRGDKTEILEARTSVAFFPHGLGHYLGMDTHDCGGNPDYEDQDSMFKYLRVRGSVPAGAVVTVEPGIYFCRFIVEPYLKDEKHKKFIDEEVLERYWAVGGVRIEDDVLITPSGYENLTTAPKDLGEIRDIISGGKSWMEKLGIA